MGHVRIGYEPEDLRKAFDGFEPVTLKKTGTCLSETAHFFWEKVHLRWNVPEEKIVFARPWLGMIHRAAERYGGTRVTVDPQADHPGEDIQEHHLRALRRRGS